MALDFAKLPDLLAKSSTSERWQGTGSRCRAIETNDIDQRLRAIEARVVPPWNARGDQPNQMSP